MQEKFSFRLEYVASSVFDANKYKMNEQNTWTKNCKKKISTIKYWRRCYCLNYLLYFLVPNFKSHNSRQKHIHTRKKSCIPGVNVWIQFSFRIFAGQIYTEWTPLQSNNFSYNFPIFTTRSLIFIARYLICVWVYGFYLWFVHACISIQISNIAKSIQRLYFFHFFFSKNIYR